MNRLPRAIALRPSTGNAYGPDLTIPEITGCIYEALTSEARERLLEHLLQPLGALSLVGVANGVFARIKLRNAWPESRIGPGDARSVRARDVVALVEFAQQAHLRIIYGLPHLLATSPMMIRSTASAELADLLDQKIRRQRDGAEEALKNASGQKPGAADSHRGRNVLR